MTTDSRPAGDGHGHAPVLGRAPLADVQVGHDLDARDDAGHHPARHRRGADEHAVDPELAAQGAVHRREVDVRRAALDRLLQQGVHEPHDGRRARVLDELLGLGRPRGLEVQRLVVDDVGERVDPVEQVLDVGGGGDDRAHGVAREERDVVGGLHVARLGHGDHQGRVVEGDRQRVVAARDVRRDEAHRALVDRELEQVDVVHAEALGHHARELLDGQRARRDERLPRRGAGRPRGGHRGVDRGAGGVAEVDDHVADEA
jgi:hypothetical protein